MLRRIKPYKGYFIFCRAVTLMFYNDALDFTSLGAYIAFAQECGWDKVKNPEDYGYLLKDNTYLAQKWKLNLSTVTRKRKKLIEQGLLEATNDGRIKLKHIDWFDPRVASQLAKCKFANKQDLIAKTQEIVANMQKNIANSQAKQPQNTPQSFNNSSKGNSSVFDKGNTDLSDDDAAWIDENINISS